MKTKFDWDKVPEEVISIATEQSGVAHGWLGIPEIMDGEWNSNRCGVAGFWILEKSNPYKGDWKDSLEVRPK